MKKNVLLILLLLSVVLAQGQLYQQTNIVLESEIPKDKDCVYEASTSIQLLPGTYSEPSKGKTVSFSINRYGVFPPEEGIWGGPNSSSQDGVVGSLPGELNISDFGAAIYSIPIMMPQGIGEMTPSVSITYNSQSGNGLLGWGWNLSGLSSITRTGKTVYHDGSAGVMNFVDDRFMLDGQRLMLCDGSYGSNAAVYKTEIDEMSKIISYTDGYNGPGHFVVYKKDGTIWEYGVTDDSRVEPQNNNNVVLKWLVSKVYDHNGNTMVFDYIENQATGESYINRIDYTLNENAGIQSMYSVIFNYEDREDKEFGYVFANLVQTKKILTGITVNNVMTGNALYEYSFDYLSPGNYSDDYRFMYNRLYSIELTADGLKLNPTIISWNSKQKHYPEKFQSYTLTKTTFNKVPFAGDFNGDGFSDVISVPYKIGNTYYEDVQSEMHLNNGDGTFDDAAYYTFSFDKTLEWVYVVDFNGDGLDDVIPYYLNDDEDEDWKSKIEVYLNDGDTFTYVGEKSHDDYSFIMYPGDFCNEKKVLFFLDFNIPEDEDDVNPGIIYYDDGSIVMETLGDVASEYDPQRISVADINGDGCTDIIYHMEDFSYVANITKSNGSYVFNYLYTNSDFDSDDYLYLGDFNGDGYADFLKYDPKSYWKISFSDGEKMTTPVSCLDNNLLRGVELLPQDRYVCSLGKLSDPSVTIRTADFDGDGKTDVALLKNTGGNYYMEIGMKMCENSDGTYGFSNIKRFYTNINHGHQYVHVGNFLGQENVSILSSVKSNPSSYEYPKIVALNPHTSKYSVERITDGLGNAHGFCYDYLMPGNDSFYEYEFEWIDNDLRTMPIPVKALRADTTFSANENPCVTEYSFRNVLFNTEGCGLLGFEKSESKYIINNSLFEKKIVERNVDFAAEHNVLLPMALSKYNYADQLVLTENYLYNVFSCAQNDKIIMPLITLKKTVNYDFDRSNAVTKTSVENFEYESDMSGDSYSDIVNLHKTTMGSDDSYVGDDASQCSYKSETVYEYSNVLSQWIVSRPISAVKSMCYENGDLVGSSDLYQYTDSNPFNITKIISLPNLNMDFGDPLKIISEYEYDALGHLVTQSQTTPSSKNHRVKSLVYGEEYNHRFPTISVNENGWEIHNTYNQDYGIMKSSVDYNDFKANKESDPFEITVKEALPDGLVTIKTKRWSAGNQHAPKEAVYYTWEKTSGKAEKLSFFTKTGLDIRDVTFGLNGEAIYMDYSYDDYGNVIIKSKPYIAGEEVMNCYYVYDKNNRLVEEIFPNGLVKYYAYNKLERTIISEASDGRQQTIIETVNPEGWRISTVDIGGNTISYSYYSDGKLKSTIVNGDESTKVEYEYDNKRNMTKMKDPASGETCYEYNAYNELKWMRTPKNCETTYEYDMIGNTIQRMEMDENGSNAVLTQWIYDNKKGKVGTLSKIVYADKQMISFDYDELLRVSGIVETIDGCQYNTKYKYDGAGREELVSYPSGFEVQKQYSNSGYYRSMIDIEKGTELWRSNNADAMGFVTDYNVGNGLSTLCEYDAKSDRLSAINTRGQDKVYQDLSYTYDDFGNLTSRAKNIGDKMTETFTYDEFNRLSEISTNGKPTGSIKYDPLGNINSKIMNGREVFYDAQYNGECPYAVSSVKTDMADLHGLNQNIEYTSFDKMSRLESDGNLLEIEYGYDHRRVSYVEIVNGLRKEKVYIGDCEFEDNNGKKSIYTCLNGPVGIFAVCIMDENGDKTIMYVHKDHLDSWCLVTDDKGNVLQNTSYDAWGNPRNDDCWEKPYDGRMLCDRGFTGHEHYVDFGVINMNGRIYDPFMSIMMSPDNNIQNHDFSQNYNRYLYCFNNPLSYYDPSGESVEWLFYGIFCGVVNMILNAEHIDGWGEGLLSFTAGFLGASLIKGFSEFSWFVQMPTKMVGNTLADCANKLVETNTDGESIDWSILSTKKFKSDMYYSIGSNMATSVLGSYIIQPTEKDSGVSISSLISKSKSQKELLEETVGRVSGNLFAGRPMFDGFKFKLKSIGQIMPYVKNTVDFCTDGYEFEKSSSFLGKAFGKVLNFDYQGFFSNLGSDMDYCYSQIRSLFLRPDN